MRYTLVIFVCSILWTDAFGQLRVVKLYWGDDRLNKEYGYSPNPPYDTDTSIAEGYLLPDSCVSVTDSIDQPVTLVLFKNSADTIPHQVGFYLNGELYGFLITWRDGKIASIKNKPGYQSVEFGYNDAPTVHFDGFSMSECANMITVLEKSIELELSCGPGRPKGSFGTRWRVTAGTTKPSLVIEQVTHRQQKFEIFGFPPP